MTQHGESLMIRAAGGVLWRSVRSGSVEVAVVHRPEYDDWSLPKGKLRRGEHPLVTACREVAEETGVRAVAGRRLEIGHYDTAVGRKAVEYWAMHGPDAPFVPTAEVDRLAWVPLTDARRRLDYRSDGYAIDVLEPLPGAALTAAVLLLHNGQGVSARQWTGGEADRPLDVTGQEQAQALGRTLPAFGSSRLLSAPGTRFSETMRLLGAELGLAIDDEPALGDDEYAARPGRGMKRILELAGAGVTTAVCASGAVVRHLLDALAEDADLALGEFRVGKGSIWALFFSGGRLAAADYYPAPTSPRP